MRITIRKFQELNEAAKTELTDIDKSIVMAKIITGLDDDQLQKMTVSKFNKLCIRINNLFAKLNDTDEHRVAPKYIWANGRKYKVNHDINNINAGRYVEVATYQSDIIGNLHKIMASIVTPMKLTWKGYRPTMYDVKQHKRMAEDFLEADFFTAYNSCIFFYALLLKSIDNLNIYGNRLAGMKAAQLQNPSQSYSDGYIMANLYQSLNQLN